MRHYLQFHWLLPGTNGVQADPGDDDDDADGGADDDLDHRQTLPLAEFLPLTHTQLSCPLEWSGHYKQCDWFHRMPSLWCRPQRSCPSDEAPLGTPNQCLLI